MEPHKPNFDSAYLAVKEKLMAGTTSKRPIPKRLSSSFVKCLFFKGIMDVFPHVGRATFRLYRRSVVRKPTCGDRVRRASPCDHSIGAVQ